MGRDLGFVVDDWDYLVTRSWSDPMSLLHDYTGHLTLPTSVLFASLKGVIGLEYWPWWYAVRLIAYGAMSFVLWRVLLIRRCDPLIALGTFVTVLFLGISFWHKPATIGNLISLSVAMVAALMVERVAEPGLRHKLLLGALLALGLASSSLSVATAVALLVVTAVIGRFRSWWPSIVIPGLGWLAWYLAFAPAGLNRLDLGLSDPASRLLAAFHDAATLVEKALTSALTAPAVYGPLLVVLVVVAVVILGLRGRLDRFDAITIVVVLLYLAMVVLVRTTVRETTLERPWYQFNIVILLVAVLVPKIPRLQTGLARAAAIVVLALVLTLNVASLRIGLAEFAARGQLARGNAETAAAMLDAGEPVAGPAALVTSGLSTERVAVLQDLGLESVIHPDRESAVRGMLRFVRAEQQAGETDGLETVTPVNDGCARLRRGDSIDGSVVGPAAITLDGGVGAGLILEWSDDFGVGRRPLVLNEPATFVTPEPAGPAEWRIRHRWGPPVEVCGLSSAGSPTPSFGQ
jgi:hypothetical protein